MARSPKEAMILCLDVGIGMQDAPQNEDSSLDQAIQVASMLIQRKIFAQSKDEIALVLFGTEDTANQLADENVESYSNISVAFPLGVPNFDLLHFMSHSLKPGTTSADFLDALTVSLDILYHQSKNKKISSRRIVLFSNFAHNSSDDNVDGIMNGFKAEGMNVELNVIGPEFEMSEDTMQDESRDEDLDNQPSTSTRPPRRRGIPRNRKPKTDQQRAGENVISAVWQSGVEGASYSFAHALQAVAGFEKQSVNSAAWKCHLTLGTDLSIPCVAYAKTKEAKLKQTWKRCHAKTHKSEDIMKNTYYYIEDDQRTEVPKENLSKGYKYGKDIIPFGQEDEQQMKYTTDGKCLNILGFTNVDNVPVHLHMDDQAHLVLPEAGDDVAAVALSAFVRGMLNQGVCAVARYVYRRGSNPKLVALYPRVKPDYQCLVMVALPFSEDVRTLNFPPLDVKKEHAPSSAQMDCVDDLITAMDLQETNDHEELFKSAETLNPFFQRTFQCLHHRSQHPDDPLPPPPSFEQEGLSGIPERAERINVALEKMKKNFVLEKKPKEETSKAKDSWKTEPATSEPSASNRASTKHDDTTLARITSEPVTSVGTVAPQDDFIVLLKQTQSQDDVRRVIREMQQRIEDFVRDPFAVQLASKIVDCLKILRGQAILKDEAETVNNFLLHIKQIILPGNTKLWEILMESDIKLIGASECNSGGASPDQQQKFESTGIDASGGDVTEKDRSADEVDDLLDMME